MMHNIGVVGAGVIGLSTAVNVQERIPNSHVTIIADKFDLDTTSDGAAGLFRPSTENLKMSMEKYKEWAIESFRHFSSLATSPLAAEAGIMIVTGYQMSNAAPINPIYKDIVFDCKEMTTKEIEKLNLGVNWRYACRVTTTITDARIYMKWLTKRFLGNEGILQKRKVESLSEFVGLYDVVVNCTGLGSRDLINDSEVYPIRGQLTRVRAPWINHWILCDDDSYVIPNVDCVVLGGSRSTNNYNQEIDMKEGQHTLEKCTRLWPQLEGCTVVNIWSGLRPRRDPPRIEHEWMQFDQGTLQVIHNYGHGGHGMTLSWGTALEAMRLVSNCLNSQRPVSKL